MSHARRRAAALALGALALTAPLASASTEVGLGELLAPGFGLADGLLESGDRLVAPGAPLAPLAPALLPALDLGRILVAVLRATANATVLGASDGDAGSALGWPDEAGAETRERTVVDGVVVPGQDVTVPERRVDVGTPGIDREVRTPAIVVPPQTIVIPEQRVVVATPPVAVPPVQIATPPVVVVTPTVATPPVRVATPPVGIGPQRVALDLRGAEVQVQELHGTIFVGPVQVPYTLGPYSVGQSLLPPEVPRQVEAGTPPVQVLPAMVLVDEPSRTVLPSQRAEVPGQSVKVNEGMQVLPAQRVAETSVPGQRVEVPGARVESVSHRVIVPAQHVTTLVVPGASHATEPVVVTEERVVLPAQRAVVEAFQGLPEAGYVGYGFADDSSLYPFACTAVVGCVRGEGLLRPWVDHGDRLLDAAAARLDEGVVIEA